MRAGNPPAGFELLKSPPHRSQFVSCEKSRIRGHYARKNKAAIRLDLISPPRIGWCYLDLADGRNEIRFFKARQTRNNSMKPTPSLTKALCLGILMVHCSLASGQYKEEQTVNESIGVLNEIMSIPAQGIPRSMLRDAQAVAIFPGVVKASFVVGARHGNGVVMIRDDKGGWHAPVFASLTGGNIGWQVGVQSTDVVLVFKTRKSVNGLLSGRMTLGADAGIAAGPIGRQATAATDSGLGSQIYSYSRSRGLFAGVSFDGSVVRMDSIRNATYYKSSTPGGPVTIPLSAQRLGREVMQYTGAATAATFSDNLNQVPTLKASTSNQSKPILAQQYSEQEVDQLRDQLAKIAPEMYGMLDPSWQRYLGLPAQVFKANGHPSVESLIKCRTNFEYVCNDPKLVKLARYPEFQSTYGLLCHYIHELSNVKTTFDLPAPPVN